MIEMLCGGDKKKREWMEGCRAYSCINSPMGYTLAEVEDKDEIIYADIDISEIITSKQWHDIIGNYTRMDVVSLNLCQDEDQPVWYTSRNKTQYPLEMRELELLKGLQENQKRLAEELERVNRLVSQSMNGLGKRKK